MLQIPESIKERVGREESLFRAAGYLNEEFGDASVTIVETGTSRGDLGGGPVGDGWATILWAWYADTFNSKVITIDIDVDCIAECMKLTSEFNNILFLVSPSVDFLSRYHEPIHLLYLDSADDPELMMEEFKLGSVNVVDCGFVLLDDVGPDFKRGKGTILGPYLLESNDWQLIYHDTSPTVNQALFRRAKCQV